MLASLKASSDEISRARKFKSKRIGVSVSPFQTVECASELRIRQAAAGRQSWPHASAGQRANDTPRDKQIAKIPDGGHADYSASHSYRNPTVFFQIGEARGKSILPCPLQPILDEVGAARYPVPPGCSRPGAALALAVDELVKRRWLTKLWPLAAVNISNHRRRYILLLPLRAMSARRLSGKSSACKYGVGSPAR